MCVIETQPAICHWHPSTGRVTAPVAVSITEAILDVEIYERLQKVGFDTASQADNEHRSLEEYISGTDFKTPQWGELDYFLLPVKALRLHIFSSSVPRNQENCGSYLRPVLQNRQKRKHTHL